MAESYNIYCDESCHLENDNATAMVLGAVWCRSDYRKVACSRLKEIKRKHGLSSRFEGKWTKVSSGKVQFYGDVLDYFFDDDELRFRALIVPEKGALDHASFNQTHDEWYYKMYFDMLKAILSPDDFYNIYIDIKDSLGAEKVEKLHEVLSNNNLDFSRKIVRKVQQIRSHEVVLMELTDLLIGAIGYVNRDLSGSKAKSALVDRMRKRSGYNLRDTTLYRERKVNVLRWRAAEGA